MAWSRSYEEPTTSFFSLPDLNIPHTHRTWLRSHVEPTTFFFSPSDLKISHTHTHTQRIYPCSHVAATTSFFSLSDLELSHTHTHTHTRHTHTRARAHTHTRHIHVLTWWLQPVSFRYPNFSASEHSWRYSPLSSAKKKKKNITVRIQHALSCAILMIIRKQI
jgi:hypothetical protein